jgi:hypothetical protein
MTDRLTIEVRLEDGQRIKLTGRLAWTLMRLEEAGEKGCTPIEQPAPRWSDYVFQLRGLGFVIETIHERHEGPFPGTHGRYVLRSKVTILRSGRMAA